MRLRGSILLILLFALIAALTLLNVHALRAQDVPGDGTPDDGKTSFDARCLSCHASLDGETAFANGDTRPVLVDISAFNASRHGASNPEGYLSCFDCHGSYSVPHEGEWESARDFRLDLVQACEGCHAAQTERNNDSVHAVAMAAGDENAATCVDCHGYHEVQTPGEPRRQISLTCAQCHSDIFNQYQSSIHGAALLRESNPDVPTCIDCHGVHNISDPTTNLARIRSPQLCANCHADEELMDKYDISTKVFDSYIDDFHGTTVTLFDHQDPDAEVNKAVCYDCHGVHNIRSPGDTESSVYKENLLSTCQRCHPDATSNFPDAWVGHYEPDPENNQLVFFVNLFYRFFIPGVMGGLLGLIVLPDAYKRIRNALSRGEK
jgi:predicted CXXCH cytochrome family protein